MRSGARKGCLSGSGSSSISFGPLYEPRKTAQEGQRLDSGVRQSGCAVRDTLRTGSRKMSTHPPLFAGTRLLRWGRSERICPSYADVASAICAHRTRHFPLFSGRYACSIAILSNWAMLTSARQQHRQAHGKKHGRTPITQIRYDYVHVVRRTRPHGRVMSNKTRARGQEHSYNLSTKRTRTSAANFMARRFALKAAVIVGRG